MRCFSFLSTSPFEESDFRNTNRIFGSRGLTFLELIIVMVIVAISATLALASVRAGVENRQARQALETAKSIGHAVRVYQLDNGALPGAKLTELFDRGYLKEDEFAFRNEYNYSFVPNQANTSRWAVEVDRSDNSRKIRVENRGDSFAVTDSKGFLSK